MSALTPVDRLASIMRHAGLSDSDDSINVAICALRQAIAARHQKAAGVIQ